MSNEKRKQQMMAAAVKYVEQGFPDIFIAGFLYGAMWADSHPQWIPVEEELPKEENAYLVSDGDGVLYGYFIEGRWAPTELNETCTHWMPLPKAPRKENEI